MRRGFSLLLALLFAAFTLLADGPHTHSGVSTSSRISSATHTLSADPADCPLCHWLNVSYSMPSPVKALISVVTAAPPVRVIPPAVSLCRMAILNPSLRAPPLASF